MDYSRECSVLPIPFHKVSPYYQDENGEHGIRIRVLGTENSWIKEAKKTHLHLIWEDITCLDQHAKLELENQQLFLLNEHDFIKANGSQYKRLNISRRHQTSYETAFVTNNRRCTTSKELFDQIATNYNLDLALPSETKWGELYDKQIDKLWKNP